MPTATRRPHRKSRHGCQQCKKNRTKCDERRPNCSRCARTGARCSLLDPSSSLVIIDRLSAKTQDNPSVNGRQLSPSASKPAPLTGSSLASFSPTNSSPTNLSATNPGSVRRETCSATNDLDISQGELERLRLMRHYCQSTWHSISDLTSHASGGRTIWQDLVPELAFKNDYLLHCVLSISALHWALTDPSTQHEMGILAVQHHNLAIAKFTPQLSNITPENIDAIFAFTCLTALYSFGIHLKGGYQLSPLVKIHEVFTMVRGTNGIVRSGHAWLQTGPWAPWFLHKEDHSAERLPDEIETVLAQLSGRIRSTITTSSQTQLYTDTIEALRKNFLSGKQEPRTQMALVTLPVYSPDGYLPMVCIGEPLALAILANWAVILHWQNRHIWLRNWGRQTVKAVQEVLPPDWQDCITWAVREVNSPLKETQLPYPKETEHDRLYFSGKENTLYKSCLDLLPT